jgi:hypothetical protein
MDCEQTYESEECLDRLAHVVVYAFTRFLESLSRVGSSGANRTFSEVRCLGSAEISVGLACRNGLDVYAAEVYVPDFSGTVPPSGNHLTCRPMIRSP